MSIHSYSAADPKNIGALALDAHADPHLADGAHFRLISHPEVGLPLEPIEVFRMHLPNPAAASHARIDVEWRDSTGQVLTEPFKVSSGNPVRGYLPPHSSGICVWIEVATRASRLSVEPRAIAVDSPGASRAPSAPSRPAVPVAPAIAFRGRFRMRFRPLIPLRPFNTPVVGPLAPVERPTRDQFGAIRMDAYQQTPTGRVLVASRSARPLRLGAAPIDMIVLTGNGKVEGVKWLEARALLEAAKREDLPVWRTMALPISGGEHYEGIANAAEVATARLERCAPERMGLHDEPNRPEPSSCSTASAKDEVERLEPFFGPLSESLQHLVDSDEALEETDIQPLLDANGVAQGTLASNLMESVLQASQDPGIAQWIGLMDRDEEPVTDKAGAVVAYILGGNWISRGPHIDVRRGLRLATIACATIGQPPAHPPGPGIDPPEPGGWLPTTTPPDAERRVVVPVRGLLDGSCVAFARKDGGGPAVSLHTIRKGRANLLIPGEAPDDPARNLLFDRHGSAKQATYRVAQRDLFGRWGGWTERALAAGERPGPPTPAISATYELPSVPEPMPSGTLAGSIAVRVPIPQLDALPPGGAPLANLELTLDGITTTTPIDDDPMRMVLTGPPIGRAGEQEVRITGRFVDIDGRVSAEGGPVVLTLRDPRPPPSPSLASGLRYTSRPDATGRAMVRISVPESAGQVAIRAFYADEVRLRHRLIELADGGNGRAQTAIDDLDAAESPPDRAAIFERESEILGRGLFELLGEPLKAIDGAAQFEHALSGSLRVLSFYRFVAVGSAQVESPFEQSTLVSFAVVPTGTPRRPMVYVRPGLPDATGAFSATLVVRVPEGNFPVTECRLLRTTHDAREVERMLAVALLAVPPDTPEFSHMDLGGSAIAPNTRLWPFTRYIWRAVVRTAAAPGGPSAEWSPPSPPVATMFLPPDPPVAPTALRVEHFAGELRVSFEHPDPRLKGGSMGQYVFEVHRQVRQEGQVVGSVLGIAAEVDGGRDTSGRFHVTDPAPLAKQATYRVTLIDPLGRRSQVAAFIFPPSA